jgi:dynein assembly factor 5
MDDAKEEIRIETALTFQHFFKAFKKVNMKLQPFIDSLPVDEQNRSAIIDPDNNIIEIRLENGHFETIIKGLLIHLDDTNPMLQVKNF